MPTLKAQCYICLHVHLSLSKYIVIACYTRCFDTGGLLAAAVPLADRAIGAAFHCHYHQQVDHALPGTLPLGEGCLLGAGCVGVS